MSGHSKWHSIRHKKGANDAKRAKILTKHSKIIMIIGRDNPLPHNNPSLRTAISNAKTDGVPKNNIERILKKISGSDQNYTNYTQQIYEGYAPGGIPIIVDALTDNVNRTFPEVKMAFTKHGGVMGVQGSVSFLFNHLGIIELDSSILSENQLLELATESSALDFSRNRVSRIISTSPISDSTSSSSSVRVVIS